MNGEPLERTGLILGYLLNGVLAFGLGALATVVMVQVVGRYGFDSPPFWTEELARFLLIWLSFIGALAAHRDGEHIRITWLSEQFEGLPNKALELFCQLLVLVLLVIITKAGIDITLMGRQTAPALGISMAWFYVALPIGTGLMATISILRVCRALLTVMRKVAR